jgi:hypothetical protein
MNRGRVRRDLRPTEVGRGLEDETDTVRKVAKHIRLKHFYRTMLLSR